MHKVAEVCCGVGLCCKNEYLCAVIFLRMKIGLFIPCYVDALYPEVGVASYKLLKALGLDVDYPLNQTCCGQPQANGGFEDLSVSQASILKNFSRYMTISLGLLLHVWPLCV